ncbi:MarR family transcriptional regulator [Saccharibacillus sp. CPCC 101409]|uniref:MarR family transcriptional regulator n=1 Tax=Saccharibacillus sp. CPCC 101409 TaxID=3058041 RepID=UPI002673CD74|nr:MarR family transcriptional regulator [Saccharibacillus sp. CPCC 101409]MDO3411887.1 MarR family transcriptional regulator [Saccharibacillus sp. CPCC 101409]
METSMYRQPAPAELYEQIKDFLHRYENHKQTEPSRLRAMIGDEEAGSRVGNLTVVRVIDCIGRFEPINGTTIAEKVELSRAGITKIGARLLREGLVKRERMRHNRKEIYYRLTPEGRDVFETHQRLHASEAASFRTFLDGYSGEQLAFVGEFLRHAGAEFERQRHEPLLEQAR